MFTLLSKQPFSEKNVGICSILSGVVITVLVLFIKMTPWIESIFQRVTGFDLSMTVEVLVCVLSFCFAHVLRVNKIENIFSKGLRFFTLKIYDATKLSLITVLGHFLGIFMCAFIFWWVTGDGSAGKVFSYSLLIMFVCGYFWLILKLLKMQYV